MTDRYMDRQTMTQQRGTFMAMATTYCLGVFNDNFFKQAAMLLAVAAGQNNLQGWAASLFALPFILFSAHGGWFADRFAKKQVIVASKAMELGAMGIGAVGLLMGSWPCVLSMVFLMGLQSTFFSPALNGAIPELFETGAVLRVNAILKLTTTLAILAGIAAAGISLDWQGLGIGGVTPGVALVSVVALMAAAAGLLASMGIRPRPGTRNKKAFPWLGPWHSLKDLYEICQDKQLCQAVVADAYFYFIASISILAINALGLQQFGFSQTKTSFLSMALMAGVCVGSLIAARLVCVTQWSRYLVKAGLGISAGLLLAGLSGHLPALMRFWWTIAALTVTGVAGGLFIIPVTSTLQIRPAENQKGRVLAAAGFSSFTAILLSGLMFNLLVSLFSPTVLLLVIGGFALLVAVAFHFLGMARGKLSAGLIGWGLKRILALRYRIQITGLSAIERTNGKGILFLPNHPALIDPIIVMASLIGRFCPRPLADADQLDKPLVRTLVKVIRPITLPDLKNGGNANRQRVHEAINAVIDNLRQGRNILFYPAGRLNRSREEDLGANSGVEFILRQIPDLQVVLVRTTGLWGSSFSHASGEKPALTKHWKRYVGALLANGLFFIPKRQVHLELIEDHTLSGLPDRHHINRYLESYYNAEPIGNCCVPCFWWQGRKPVILPEPTNHRPGAVPINVPQFLHHDVYQKIKALSGEKVEGHLRLSQDLGLDSLTIMELGTWIEREFAVTVNDLTALSTVNDCILAAAGQLQNNDEQGVAVPPATWLASSNLDLSFATQTTITDLFLQQADRSPGQVVLADRIAGAKTYQDILTAISALQPALRNLPGERVGILLPASVACSIVYLAVLFSGKTPVLFNWTAGVGNMAHGIGETGIQYMITAGALYTKIEEQYDIHLKDLAVQWLYLDKWTAALTRLEKLRAWFNARFRKHLLTRTHVSETAVILFTSGSESRPKAVPLTHANILSNLQDFSQMVELSDESRLLGMLPPFHSLGLVGTVILPLCSGLKTVYHPNPTEPVILADMIEKYKVSMLIGTPTFINGILQSAEPTQLQSVQVVFTGAEKCPEQVRSRLQSMKPGAELFEGYGITECSPLVSINAPGNSRSGTIGKVLPTIEYVIVNDHGTGTVPSGQQGLLLVRGPSIFNGYLGRAPEEGFCEFNKKRWYATGDYVAEDSDGYLVFRGRKKRFIKIGGEMISLPAIESALLSGLGIEPEAGPVLAIEATSNESHPEIVLFTTQTLNRNAVNQQIKRAGLSAVHHIRRMVQVDAIPVLGTGKTDYQLLRQQLAA